MLRFEMGAIFRKLNNEFILYRWLKSKEIAQPVTIWTKKKKVSGFIRKHKEQGGNKQRLHTDSNERSSAEGEYVLTT